MFDSIVDAKSAVASHKFRGGWSFPVRIQKRIKSRTKSQALVELKVDR
jgi:hypothetical protein